MIRAIIAIGIPGSGKTTMLKPLAATYGLTYVNRDDIREEMHGNATDQSNNKVVWEEANRRTSEALGRDQGVVLDSTFVELWKRKDMITYARSHGAERVIGLYFPVAIDTAKERNAARERIVPDDVMDWMQEKLAENPPGLEDGFDALYTVAEIAKLEEHELRKDRS